MKPPGACLSAALGAVFLLAAAPSNAAPPDGPTSLTISTASPGSTTLLYGQGLAKVLTESLGIAATAQPTQGADQNIVLLETGQTKLALVTLGPTRQAWNGTGDWTHGKSYRAMRAIFPMFDTPFDMVVLKESGIHSVADMAGRRVVTGPKGGTGGTYYPAIFEVLNVPAAVRSGAWSESAKQFLQHQLDVLAISVGTPFALLQEIKTRTPLEYVAFTGEQVATLRKAMPEFSASVVPAGTYASLATDYPTVGMYNFAIAHKDLPDDLVYAIVKAAFQNRDRLIAAHPAARETLAANAAKNTILAFHPGALRYYREIGVAIPDALTKGE